VKGSYNLSLLQSDEGWNCAGDQWPPKQNLRVLASRETQPQDDALRKESGIRPSVFPALRANSPFPPGEFGIVTRWRPRVRLLTPLDRIQAPFLFATGKKRAQVISDAQDDVHESGCRGRCPGERLRCADGRAGWEPFGYHPEMGGYPDLFNHLLKRYEAPNIHNVSDGDGCPPRHLRRQLFSLRVRGTVWLHPWRPALCCSGISTRPHRIRHYCALGLSAYSSRGREMLAPRQMENAASDKWRTGRPYWAAPGAP
jgi:hypothetical protein